MAEMSVDEAGDRLDAVVDRTRAEHEPVYLTRDGRRVAAIVAAEELARLVEATEDLHDLRAAELARGGEPSVPWGEVKAQFDLDQA